MSREDDICKLLGLLDDLPAVPEVENDSDFVAGMRLVLRLLRQDPRVARVPALSVHGVRLVFASVADAERLVDSISISVRKP
jgi:hypothetical protein